MLRTKFAVLSMLTSILVIGAGCASSDSQRSTGEAIDDTAMAARVKAALVQNPATKARDINVEVNRGEVQLAGFVDTDAEKAEAARVARSVEGVRGVRNDLQVQAGNRSAGQVVDDSMITAKVKAALVGDTRTKAYQIDVNTKQGVVQLAGYVDSPQAKTAAAEVAKSISGVQSVRNDLEVRG